jgi:hypothetical protein
MRAVQDTVIPFRLDQRGVLADIATAVERGIAHAGGGNVGILFGRPPT